MNIDNYICLDEKLSLIGISIHLCITLSVFTAVIVNFTKQLCH